MMPDAASIAKSSDICSSPGTVAKPFLRPSFSIGKPIEKAIV